MDRGTPEAWVSTDRVVAFDYITDLLRAASQARCVAEGYEGLLSVRVVLAAMAASRRRGHV